MRSRPAPLGAWVYKNFNCCGPPAAPEFLKPAHPIQFPPQGQPVSGPYASSESFLSFAGAAHWAARRQQARCRWFGKPRHGSGAAGAAKHSRVQQTGRVG